MRTIQKTFKRYINNQDNAIMFRRSRSSSFVVIVLGIFILAAGYVLFKDMTAPVLTITPRQEIVSPTLPFTVTATDEGSAIKKITVTARRNGQILPVIEQSFTGTEHTQQLSFTLKNAGLGDSAFELEVSARDDAIGGFGRGNTRTEVLPMRIDSTPPRITIKTPMPYMRRGGSGCVLYSISKEVTQTGVKTGSLFSPAFRQQNGDYLCFFAFPYNLDPKDYQPQIIAVDIAGNAQISPLQVTRINRSFRHDSIAISQGFLDTKAEEFQAMAPGDKTDLERFLAVNIDIRKNNIATLMEIGKDTSPEMLWKGVFLRLPNSATRSGFADNRTYLWQGREVDNQTHLGLDFASVAQAPVPAANTGRVVFAGYLGIYGNMIVIDHGLGLQSLYSHMSQIGVEKGQSVQKGDIIGHTGATGMAGGDHLHFGILLSGLEVTPVEWLDAHWIKDNITDRIKAVSGGAPANNTPAPSPSSAGSSPRQ